MKYGNLIEEKKIGTNAVSNGNTMEKGILSRIENNTIRPEYGRNKIEE